MLVFPVTAPLITSGRSAFPRVARLTRDLRWNPLALDIADAIVASRGATVAQLAAFLERAGIRAVRVIDHEDDLPEVALLVQWAWKRLPAASRRMLGVLSHVEGDSVDLDSLAARRHPGTARSARRDRRPRTLALVQEPMRAGRRSTGGAARGAKAEASSCRARSSTTSVAPRGAPERSWWNRRTSLRRWLTLPVSDLSAMLRIERCSSA